MIYALLAFFVVSAHAQPQQPPAYGQPFQKSTCPGDKQSRSPWAAFSADAWDKIEDADKAAIIEGYCHSGSVLFSYSEAEKTLNKALASQGEGLARLRELENANHASLERFDITCKGRLDDGRAACQSCCKRLTGLRKRLVDEENALAVSERAKEKLKTQTTVKVSADAMEQRRLNEEKFSGSQEKQGPRHRNFDNVVVEVEDSKPKAGTLRDNDEARKKYARDSSPPPSRKPSTPSEREAAYIQAEREKYIFGFKWYGERDAKMAVDKMHGYINNCATTKTYYAPCHVCPAKAEIDPENAGYCDSELLKRTLGR